MEHIEYIMSGSFLIGGVLVGYILDKIIIAKLKRVTEQTSFEGDNIIVNSLCGVTFLWGILAGIYGAIFYLPISQHSLDILHKILLVITLFSGTLVLSRIAVGLLGTYTKKIHGTLPSTSIFINIARIVVYTLGILVILQSLGISITPLLTALGVGGLAVALALQDTLSNLFSGLHILASKQVRPGDYIKLDSGEEGYVLDITWRNTAIKALPNNLIVIPNSKLASTIVTNYDLPDKELAVLVQVGVHYNSDLEKVEQVTIETGQEVMRKITGGVQEFNPFIRYHTFGESSINFTVILRGKEFVDQFLIKHEFIKRLKKRYDQENIEIPFPIRTVYLKKENHKTELG
ncbi:MAG: mechanosensitive ion channel family protein [Planctomycetes bacterium]|nr:mechanosensitive ion channel family protein [Planctomycetota bacterium]